MRAMTSILYPSAVPFARAAAALIGAATSALRQFSHAYRNRRNAVLVAALDDRMLADLGLTRSDVRDAVAAPLWHDPTHLLRARALERRLTRHRVSLGLTDPDLGSPPLAPPDQFTRLRTDRAARLTV